MAKTVLRFLNGIYGWLMGAAILAAAAFAGYSLWDNAQIYHAAQDVQDQIRQLKPKAKGKKGPGFEKLRAVNKDVVGWLTLPGTNIDYPVLRGKDNLTYMNKDVYGNFSLAGSIFLDSRNKADLSDSYCLVYGHNMDEHLMFGDLALFKKKAFFRDHKTATLLVPGEKRKLNVAAVLQISAGTEEVFNPDEWKKDLTGFGRFLERHSIWYHADLIRLLKAYPEAFQVLTMVTCSNGSTNDRTVLVAIREKTGMDIGSVEGAYRGRTDAGGASSAAKNQDVLSGGRGAEGLAAGEAKEEPIQGSGPKPTGDAQNKGLWTGLIILGLLVILVMEGADRFHPKDRE